MREPYIRSIQAAVSTDLKLVHNVWKARVAVHLDLVDTSLVECCSSLIFYRETFLLGGMHELAYHIHLLSLRTLKALGKIWSPVQNSEF